MVLVDCPPSLGALTQTALATADEVVMPLECEYFAMEGLTQMIELIKRVMQRSNSRLQFGGILLTKYDPSLELTHEVDREVRDFFGDIVFRTVAPRTWRSPRRRATVGRSWTTPRGAAGLGLTSSCARRCWDVSNQRRLGRGLEALLGRSLDQTEATTGAPAPMAPVSDSEPAPVSNPAVMSRDDAGQTWLDVGVVEPNPHQPRKHFDETEIADLADSIREHGVLQPLVVREVDGRYELIAGERRLRAAQMAAWDRVPVQLKAVTDQQMAELAIVENVQRKDLNALEKAASFQRYLDQYGCTQDDLAKRIHIDRSTIANLIRLLELPEQVKGMLTAGDLSQGHARALLPLGDESEQVEFAQRIKKESLSVRATEQAVQNHVHALDDDLLRIVGEDGVSRKPSSATARSEQLAHLEQELQTAVGTKVALTQNAKGKGKITLHFKDGEEFERLRSLLTSGAGAAKEMA